MTTDEPTAGIEGRAGLLRTRRRLLAAGVVIAVLAGAAGWTAASQVRSPADVAADTAPPEPSSITATVDSKVLDSDVVTRGSVIATDTVQVGTGGPPGVLAPVVTKVPVRPGDVVAPGDLLLEVAGRPLLLLPGDLPAYRDLRPGMTGPDVVQLQAGLAAAGHPAQGDPRGRFGPATGQAVAAMYVEAGYAPRQDIPVSEIAYVPESGARVQAVGVRRGEVADQTSVTLSTGEAEIVSSLDGSQASLLRPPMEVEVYSEVLDKRISGTLREISAKPPAALTVADGGAPAAAYAVIEPDSATSQDFIGQDVRVTFNAGHSDGDVLVVPVSAVYSTVDGQTNVLVEDADGGQHPVEVRVGITASGMAEVKPVAGADLAKGDHVVVGAR
jgi:hypothetical protein